MKIASITQTYQFDHRFSSGVDGKDRSFLVNYHLKDSPQIKLKSLVDLQTFNFHNYNIEEAKTLSKKIKEVLPNTKCTIYNNMTLGQSIFSHLDFLRIKGITDILWIQDDEFSLANDKDIIDAFNYYKSNKLINLSLCYSSNNIDTENINCEEISKDLVVYRSSTQDFTYKKLYGMDFSAFICNLDLIYNAFKNIDLMTLDAYKLEGDFSTFMSKFLFPRCVLNKPLFKTFNIVGMLHSLGDANKNYDDLQKRFASS